MLFIWFMHNELKSRFLKFFLHWPGSLRIVTPTQKYFKTCWFQRPFEANRGALSCQNGLFPWFSPSIWEHISRFRFRFKTESITNSGCWRGRLLQPPWRSHVIGRSSFNQKLGLLVPTIHRILHFIYYYFLVKKDHLFLKNYYTNPKSSQPIAGYSSQGGWK